MKPERRQPGTTLTMALNSMTKRTLLMVAGLVVAAALLAVACDVPPAGQDSAVPSDPEQVERQSETPEPEATAVAGETPSDPERQERQSETPEPDATAIPGETPSDPEQQERQTETPEPEATALPGETPSGLSSVPGHAAGRRILRIHQRRRGPHVRGDDLRRRLLLGP